MTPQEDDEARRRRSDRLYAIALVPLTAAIVALLLVFFVYFHYSTVAGDSMVPTLLPGDRLLLTKGYGAPRRGDIVVFLFVENGAKVEVVKRVVGLPGDTVETRGDLAWVNGKPESSGYSVLVGDGDRLVGPLTVPKGGIFVLGDNRPISLDSRYIGTIPLTSVIGRAVAIFWPVPRLRSIPTLR